MGIPFGYWEVHCTGPAKWTGYLFSKDLPRGRIAREKECAEIEVGYGNKGSR